MHITSDVSKLSAIVDDLASQGWSQQADFLPAELVSALAAECHRRAGDGQLNPAGVGRGGTLEVREAIRGDHIRWLEPGESSACDR
ncbi:2OG-Fe(II) oxygenase, partial [Peribacillus simplex]